MDPITLAFVGMTAFKAIAGWFGGRSAQNAANINAANTSTIANANADLIDEGSGINAGILDYNADALHGQAIDAIARGREEEDRFRTEIKGLIGTQRAAYASQSVDVASGSAMEVQQDTAFQGEMDALTLRTNAAREAWGFDVAAKSVRLNADGTRRLGKLQSDNVRDTGRLNAATIRAGGNADRAAANWGVGGTILSAGYEYASMRRGNG